MRRPLTALVFLVLAALLGGSLAAGAATPNDAACRKATVSGSPSTKELLAYDACRFDKLDAAVAALKPKPTPVPAPSPTTSPASTPRPTSGATSAGPSASPSPGASQPSAQPAACVGAPNTPGGADPWGGCWPGPQNTGYPHGVAGDSRKAVSLTDYTGPTTIRTCGVVIDSKTIKQDLLIEAGSGGDLAKPCVTITNSLVEGVIFSERATWGPLVVRDSTVKPNGLSWWENIGRSNTLVERVDSTGSQGVVKCDQNCVVRDSWVHGMRLGGAYHYNAAGGNGTDRFTVEHNWLTCGDWSSKEDDVVSGSNGDAGCSAVIGFYGDYAPFTNSTIHRNHLLSTFDMSATGRNQQSAYCLNPGYYPGKPYGTVSKVSITDNVFGRGGSGKCGVYGPVNSIGKAIGDNTWSGNRYDDGVTIPVELG